jgi:hypothetical protein
MENLTRGTFTIFLLGKPGNNLKEINDVGNDLTKGTTYVDGGMLNAANLNAHVDDAVFKSTCISARTAKAAMAVTDELLINDSGTLKKVTGSVLYDMTTQTGAVIQSTYGFYATSANLAAAIPIDDTVPQIGEGTLIISVSFTPRFVNSKMVLRFSGQISTSAASGAIVALFRDSGPNAIGATLINTTAADIKIMLDCVAVDLPATAATITYTVRAGPGAGTMRFNGNSAARLLGGASSAILEVQEVRVP